MVFFRFLSRSYLFSEVPYHVMLRTFRRKKSPTFYSLKLGGGGGGGVVTLEIFGSVVALISL